jgi:hypothetical protein
MRNKREEGRGTKSSTDCAVDKKKAVISKSTGRRNQENGGEMLVRYITSRDDADTEMVNGFMKNPFTENKMEDSSNTEARASIDMEKCSAQEDFTKFHLEDDEMLLELMIHLHADCPDLMNDKTDLIERVSKLYDKIHVNTTP